MTIASDAFRRLPAKGYQVFTGPTKFQLMLALLDGEHGTRNPRLYNIGADFGNGKRTIHVHILGATWEGADTWILEGIEGYCGMNGLVEKRRILATYSTANKKGVLKYLS